MKSFCLTFVLFFFLLLISPAYAYLDVELNTTTLAFNQYTNVYGLDCVNNTANEVFCYVLTTDNNAGQSAIRRYNSTWGNVSAPCVISDDNNNGITVLNETFAVLPMYNGSSYCQMYDIKDIANGNCILNLTVAGSCGTGAGQYNKQNGAYNGSALFLPIATDYINLTLDNIGSNYWYDGSINQLSMPDKTDDSVIWTSESWGSGKSLHTGFTKWVSGSATNTTDTPKNIWDIGFSGGCGIDVLQFDIITVDGVLRGYALDINTVPCNSFETDFAYIVNMTDFDTGYDSSVITAISPINNASALANPPQLYITLLPATNGTVTWYVDGVSVGTSTVPANATVQNLYFTPLSALTTEGHQWEANFTDSLSNVWPTGTQNFLVGIADFFTDPLEATAQIVGWFFSMEDLDVSKNIFALLSCVMVAIGSSVAVSMFLKKMDGKSMMSVFFGTFLIMLLVFWNAGFLADWYILAIFGIFFLVIWLALRDEGG